MMKTIGIIPARYASTRFPAKPLAVLGGKPVIQRVYEQVAGALDDAVVATDDERIYEAVQAFGGWCYGGVADTAQNIVDRWFRRRAGQSRDYGSQDKRTGASEKVSA